MRPWTEDPVSPLPFVLDDRPERIPDRHAHRVLEVVSIFGDSVNELRHLPMGSRLTLGGPGDLLAPAELVEAGVPVATHARGWTVHLDPRWEARFADGRPATGDVALEDGDQLVVGIGSLTLVLREVWRTRRLPVPMAEVDRPMLALLALIGVATGLAGWMASLLPAPVTRLAVQDDGGHAITVMQALPRPASGGAATEAGGGATAGDPPRRLRRAEASGGRPEPAGILGALTDGAAASVFGSAGLASDLSQGIVGLQAASTGLPGLGLGGRCLGQDCAGFGSSVGDGIGDVGTRSGRAGYGDSGLGITRSEHSAKLLAQEPILLGNVNAADIDRVVKRHLSAIRWCYQRELQKKPDLAGKVKVKFTIAKDGTVSSASPATSSLDSPAAEACISREFFRMVFPEPKGGGMAIVSYPFLFSPG